MTTTPHTAAPTAKAPHTTFGGRRALWLAAVAAAAGPLLIAGSALLPVDMQGAINTAKQARDVLTDPATAASSAYLGLWLSLFGILAGGIASAALLRLVPDRGRRFITAGVALTAVGVLGEIVITSADVLVRRAVAVTGADDQTSANILQRAFYHGAGIGQFAALSNLLGVAVIVLGIGIVRSHALPAWIGWLPPVGVIIGTVIAPAGPLGAVFALPLTAAYLGIAAQLGRPAATV